MSLPAEMTVVELAAFGGPEQLRLGQRPTPRPGEGEVLIRVAAAGVNRPDVIQRTGKYPPPPGASDILGLEVAGEVVATGPGVESLSEGDRVCALLAGGGYADYAVAPAVQCLPIPRGLSEVEAAGLPETFFTVWHNIFDRGGFKRGETVLIHGGSSGIGVTAIQMVAALGGHPIVTVGSAEKAARCRELGANVAINYRSEDFVEAVLAATGGRGADIVLDMVGGDYLPRNLACAALDGRVVQIAFLHGHRAQVDLSLIMRKRLTLTGSTLRARSPADKGVIADCLRRRIWPAIESAAIRPVVDSVFPFERAEDAHRRLESSEHVGKVILQPRR